MVEQLNLGRILLSLLLLNRVVHFLWQVYLLRNRCSQWFSGFVVRIVKGNTKSDAIIEYVDVVPTILDAAGAPTPNGLDGRSFLPVLNGSKRTHKKYIQSSDYPRCKGSTATLRIRTVVDSRLRYIRNLFPENEFSIPASRNLTKILLRVVWMSSFSQRYSTRPKEELLML